MLKIVFSALLIFSLNTTSAKTAEIVIFDQLSKEPIQGAVCVLVETFDTLISNERGEVLIEELEKFNYLGLKIEAVGYESRTMHIEQIRFKNDELNCYLKPLQLKRNEYYKSIRDAEWDLLKLELEQRSTSDDFKCELESELNQFPDIEAKFPGPKIALSQFIANEIQYPDTALANDEQGKVYTSFIVEKDGRITGITIERGVSKLLDEECIRVLKSMPLWIPAYCHNSPVRSRARLPIVFAI